MKLLALVPILLAILGMCTGLILDYDDAGRVKYKSSRIVNSPILLSLLGLYVVTCWYSVILFALGRYKLTGTWDDLIGITMRSVGMALGPECIRSFARAWKSAREDDSKLMDEVSL